MKKRFGLGFRVKGLGFRVQGLEFRVSGSRFQDLLVITYGSSHPPIGTPEGVTNRSPTLEGLLCPPSPKS